MRFENLLRTVESYLKSRAAIIRLLNDRKMKPGELEATLQFSYALLFRRRQNPSHWRSSELKMVAEALGLSPAPIAEIETVVAQIDGLPNLVRVLLLKETRIDARRIAIRRQDPDLWQCEELERLAAVLHRWQDTKGPHTS